MNAQKTVMSVVLAAALLVTAPAESQTRTETRETGTVLRDGVPETYVVVRGDTLWDIAARFLRDPWLWPDIWTVNPEIDNPHLIFPGDIIRLVWVDGRPRLVLEREPDPRVERLEPRVRERPLDDAIRLIPLEVIRPFLSRPQVVDRDTLDDAPYILRSADGRLMSGEANRVYARGFGNDDDMELNWTIVRPAQPLRDPETRRVIGYEAEYVGEGVVDRLGDPATLRITRSSQEALAGDRLVNLETRLFDGAVHPRAPAREIDGHLVSRVGGGMQIGQYHIVTINRGADDGLEPGMVLSVWRPGERVRDTHRSRWGGRNVQLPDERIGEMLVFNTAGGLSYALVMRSTRDMVVGDRVRNP